MQQDEEKTKEKRGNESAKKIKVESAQRLVSHKIGDEADDEDGHEAVRVRGKAMVIHFEIS